MLRDEEPQAKSLSPRPEFPQVLPCQRRAKTAPFCRPFWGHVGGNDEDMKVTVYESPNPTPARLVPVSIYPGANLEDAGFSDEQRTDLLGWFLQVGSGAAGAAIGVKDVHYDVLRGFAWIRLEVLGPAGHGHVDVVLAVKNKDVELQCGAWHVANIIPADLKSFGALTDQYIATITGPASITQHWPIHLTGVGLFGGSLGLPAGGRSAVAISGRRKARERLGACGAL